MARDDRDARGATAGATTADPAAEQATTTADPNAPKEYVDADGNHVTATPAEFEATLKEQGWTELETTE